ncbi:MAG TPA: autotransporter-associated beta strand repeat-containing protein, partial [Verrucomicrobiae bacterium]|nr:autotransporter-associated beta strand repeat-containing protein [Verrucomicrobiae bacterium]
MKAPTVKIITVSKLRSLLTLAVIAASARFASAAVEVWNGANFTTATTNWSDTANWLPVGTPGAADTAVFGVNGTVSDALTVNNVVDANTTVGTLRYTNSTSGQWHVTAIPAGVTLTASNVTIGGISADNIITSVALTGGGTLLAYGSTFNVGNSGTSGSASTATADFSGLSNFVYAVPTGTFNLGNNGARSIGNMTLAAVSNSITATNFSFEASASSSSVSGTLNLGTGTNIFNVSSNLIGSQRSGGTIQFASGNTTGGIRWRGTSGADSDRANMTLGWRNAGGTSGTSRGRLFFNDHPVDMKLATLVMGQETGNGSPITADGELQFTIGTVDATTINMAICSGNSGATSTATLTVGTNATLGAGATLVVGTGGLSLVNQTLGTSTGNLTIPGGTVNCAGNIFKTTTAGSATITVNGGAINMSGGGNIGFPTNVIDNVSLSDSTLTLAGKLSASVFANNLTAGGAANTINVTSVPTFFSYPAQFPLISYVNTLGDNTTFTNGTLPGSLQGYISNNVNGLSIDIVITNGPALAQLKSIRWSGTPTGDWTTNAGTLNWLTNSTAVNYNQGDTVTFDDTLTGTPNVNLTMVLTPGDFTVNNNTATYLFTGTGKVSGSTGLTKSGNGTLILDNTGTNDFAGPVAINAGTVQIGNNDANGNLPAVGSWDVEGTLAFKRTDNLTLAQTVTGAGSLVQNGSGTLSINISEPYTGATVVNSGALALTSAGSVSSSSGIFPRGGAFDISTAAWAMTLPVVGSASGGNFVVGTNIVNVTSLSTTNSTITLNANANFMSPSPSIVVNSLTTAGTTNYVNITGVANVPDGQPVPIVIPIISYSSATFVGGFNMGETNFPNAFLSNDVLNSTIDLVLTASPYVVTWTGGSPTGNNWSDSKNWGGTVIYPNDSLFFDGATRLTPLNDTAPDTTYSNLTFNGGASTFTLSGNAVTLTGGVVNNSPNPQTVNLPVDYASSISLNGTGAPLIIGGGITNTHAGLGFTTNTLTGTGILTNLLGRSVANGGTNLINVNDSSANWTLMDNAASTTSTVPWALAINSGTFNFGSATSAPKLVSTSPQGVPQDNQMGGTANATSTLNFSNGVFTTSARFNTGSAGGASSTINQYGGTFNIASQFQGANGSGTAVSTVNLFGGTMNIGVSPNTTNSSLLATNFGTFFVASRGNGTLTITNSALLNCGTLDVSRSINSSIPGIVNLDGGTIVANNVGTATSSSGSATTGSTATFYFNGGTLKARTSSATFFQGRTTAPIVPVTAYVTARGANIDSDTNSITFVE